MKRLITVALACALVFPAGLSAQGSLRDSIAREATRAALTAEAVEQKSEPPTDWNAVLALTSKTRVKVVLRDDRTIIGNVASADAGSIVIDRRWSDDERISRDEVREIRMRPRRSTGGSAAIGWLSGLAAGSFLGWAAGCDGPCTGDERAQGSVLGGAFGSAVGFWTGFGTGAVKNLQSGKLIYRAPITR